MSEIVRGLELPVPAWADLVGVPFEWGGRGPAELDCYGLLMELHRRNGVQLPDFDVPEDKQSIVKLMADNMSPWLELPAPQRGCSVLMHVRTPRGVQSHVGFMVSSTHMLHTWEASGGVTREPLEHWQRRALGYYHFRGMPR